MWGGVEGGFISLNKVKILEGNIRGRVQGVGLCEDLRNRIGARSRLFLGPHFQSQSLEIY